MIVISMITVRITWWRSFKTWIRVRKYRFRVSRGRSSIVRYVVALVRSRSRAFSSFAERFHRGIRRDVVQIVLVREVHSFRLR